MTNISLITLEYNSAKHTDELLESLEKVNLKDIDLQVIIVDNASKNSTKHSSKTLSLTYLLSEKNLGFTGGNNLGIRHAFKHFEPDYILLLNNDTLVDLEFLQRLLDFSQQKPDLGVLCPMIYFAPGYEFHSKSYSKDEQGKVVWFAGGSIDWQNMYAFHRGVDEVDRGQFQPKAGGLQATSSKASGSSSIPYFSTDSMDFATGCCMFIPAEVLQHVGLFNDNYFLYWEDVELSQRIRDAGYQIYFCPDSKVWHKNAGSSGGSGSELHKKYQERNRLRFAMRYAPWSTKLAVVRDYFK